MSLIKFLEESGDLHDAILRSLTSCLKTGSLTLEFDDIYANFEGMPEYPGVQSGNLKFEGVQSLIIDIPKKVLAWHSVCGFSCREFEDGFEVTLSLRPAGEIRFTAHHVITPEFFLKRSSS